MQKVEFMGQPNCYKLSNGTAEAIVTTNIGPRILSYSFAGGPNLLGETPDDVVKTTLGDWKPWGGHRLWVAPESNPRSYWPDNTPINFDIQDEYTIRLQPPLEEATGIRKEMVVSLIREGTNLVIEHRVTNENLWAIELAPWAITILRGGGTAILPQEPYKSWDEWLLPARPLVLWHYTNLADPRFQFGPKFLRIRTDERADSPQKVGVLNKRGWAAYHINDTLFVKRIDVNEGFLYPDFGSNNEVYTKGSYIEIESLGPLETLEPGETAIHYERWELHNGIRLTGDDELETTLLQVVAQ